MNFELSAKQQKLVRNFREYSERVFNPESVKRWCADGGLPDEVVKEFADVYFASRELGSESGADGYDLMARALILEEMSRCAGTTLPFQHDFFNLQIIDNFSDDKIFSDVLAGYREEGRLMFAVAISEAAAGSDVMGIKTNTRTVGGKLLLNGEKSYVFNGEYSPYVLVAAIDLDDDTPSKYPHLGFWLVPHNCEGLRAYPIEKIAQSMVPFSSMRFDSVELRPEWRLGKDAASFQRLFKMLDTGRVFICASSLGMAQGALEDAVRMSSERVRFGRRVSEFQQIEQLLTDMEVRVQAMRAMVYKAAWEIDNGADELRLTSALMKRYVPAAATQVASDAMQVLGSFGYTEQSRVARIWRDCRGNQIAEGTDQIMVRVASPLIMEKYSAR